MMERPLRMSKEELYKNRMEIREKLKEIKREIRKIKRADHIDLEDKDREIYESWNNAIKENKKRFGEIAIPYKNEKDYLIKKLESNKAVKESFLVHLVCEEKGHISGKGGAIINGSYIQEQCKRCGMLYKRGLSQKEYQEWNKLIHTPMTI